MTPAELRALLAKADWSDATHPATERLTDALPALIDVAEAAEAYLATNGDYALTDKPVMLDAVVAARRRLRSALKTITK